MIRRAAEIAVLLLFVLIAVMSAVKYGFKEDNKPQNRFFVGFDVRLGPKEDVELYEPFVKYLSSKTGYDFRLRFSDDYSRTYEMLGKGHVQFALIGGAGFVDAKRKYNIRMLARGVNAEGKASYRSIIFTKKDSAIKTLSDLKGKSFAFGAVESTQGHLIARKMLEDAGIRLKSYVYTGSHQGAVDAVLSGKADAGAAQDMLIERLSKDGKVRIIAVSEEFPSSGIAVNRYVDAEIVEKVKDALLSFDPKGKHKNIHPQWNKTEMAGGFIESQYNDYDRIESLALRYGIIK
jgi:phosphonate transport system substrate-binding protein